MEMDRQTLIVLCGAILALTLIGGTYLSSPSRSHEQATFAQDDIRYKFQQEALKEKKHKKKKPPAEPIISSSESTGGDGGDESNEEPSDSDTQQEEPELD